MRFTEEQGLIKTMAHDFAYEKLRPHAGEWDEQKHFPIDILREAAALGLGALYAEETYGGSGLSRLDGVLAFEELSKGCIATAAYLSIHNMVTGMIDRFGTPEQRAHWVPKLATMELLSSYCLTEPASGSDAAALKTKASLDADDYVLSGTKQFISGAGATHLYLVMARTGQEGPSGISAFIVPSDAKGLSFGANEKKMGWHAQPTRQVIFDNVRIPKSHLLGLEGEGFKFAMQGLDGGRLNIAACALGGAQDALDRAMTYVSERQQFGKTLNGFQVTQFKLADMETELQAARTLLYQAAQNLDDKTNDATK